MGAFKEIAIEIMEAEEKLGRELSEAERQKIQDEYVRGMNQFIDSLPGMSNEELVDMCEQCEAGVLHIHEKKDEEPYFDFCDSTIKNGEATFLVYLTDDESVPAQEITATFSAYASEDEAYAEDVFFYINDNEVSETKHKRICKKYAKLIDALTERLDDWCQENGYELYQDRMIAAADFAYDCWKDEQMERGE